MKNECIQTIELRKSEVKRSFFIIHINLRKRIDSILCSIMKRFGADRNINISISGFYMALAVSFSGELKLHEAMIDCIRGSSMRDSPSREICRCMTMTKKSNRRRRRRFFSYSLFSRLSDDIFTYILRLNEMKWRKEKRRKNDTSAI